MDYKVLDFILNEVKLNKKVSLATITRVEGSTPAKEGSIMAVKEDGLIVGTIGGGNLELSVINEAKKCMENSNSKMFSFKLTSNEGSLHMQCGGDADVFIKVFVPNEKLILVGGGHVSLKLYELAKMMGFYTVIFDDREEFCNKDRFPNSDELVQGDINIKLSKYNIDENCYIVIVTRGHEFDEIALKNVLDREAKYIGMIGSKNKTKHIMEKLISEGYPNEKLDKVYAPIGIGLGGQTPEEVAFSIMSEILLIKNKGKLSHMKEIMKWN